MTVRLPLVLAASLLLGATADREVPSVDAPLLEVTLTEGTNMAAHVSPDGSTLVLDLVGRIWTLPVSGGAATALTDPFGDARQPQWSPDGRRIVFQAYWSGDYDVWVVDADGGNLEQLTSGPFDDREPAWSPDGQSVVFSSDRSGSYDIWTVDVASLEVRRRTDDPGNEYTASVAPDGRTMAWVTDGDEAGVWTGTSSADARRIVVLGDSDGYSPSWSPDGGRIAYVRIGNAESALHVVEATGTGVRTISAAGDDVFPFRPTWLGQGQILYTANGNVVTAPVGGGNAERTPFTATVELDRPTYRKKLRDFEGGSERPVRGIVSPSLAPDGETIVFSALGDLWTMRIGDAPQRLTDDAFVEVDPGWSPDGSRLAYATDRGGSTNIWIRDLATGEERPFTTDGGSMPAWSPDGTEIAYSARDGIRVTEVGSGASRLIRTGLNSPGRPSWSPDGRHVAVSALSRYSTRFREGLNRPLLIPASRTVFQQPDHDTQGAFALAPGHLDHGRAGGSGDVDRVLPVVPQEGERWLDFAPHASFASRGTDGPIWSPDGRKMTYVASGVLWVVDVGQDGDPVGPPRRLNNERTSDPSWSGDSRRILYLSTDRMRTVDLASGRIADVPFPMTWEAGEPTRRYVIHAGAVFDGVSEELRHDMDVVIHGNRIARVEAHDDRLHDGEVLDASDGVVAPGLIEMHMHGGLGGGEHLGRQWLSFGVTTVRTPSADPFEMVEAREADGIGRRLEPRMFGTGNTIDGSRVYYAGAPALTSSGQVELEVAQAADLDFDLLKTYVRLSDPVQRRVVTDAHALGLPVTSHELYPAVAIGADGVEHVKGTSRRGYSTKVSELNRSYQDVVELLARSGMTITPTIGIYGAYAVVAEDDPSLFDDRRVETFVPWAREAATRGGDLETRREMVRSMASLGRRVVEAGGTVVVGTDSPIIPQGLALVAEMQALVEYGGMSEIDVLRATTSVSADAMGYGDVFGSVRPGLLADLIVLDRDPTTDITAIRDIRMVIENGRAHTLEDLLQRPGS